MVVELVFLRVELDLNPKIKVSFIRPKTKSKTEKSKKVIDPKKDQ